MHNKMDKRNASLSVHNNSRITGELPEQLEGLVAILVDEQVLTHVPISHDAAANCGTFVFQTSATLSKSLPQEYTLAAELPCGTRLTYPDKSPLGTGDGTLLEKMAAGFIVSAKAGYLFKPPSSRSQWREDIFKTYNSAREIMAEIEGISGLFAAYGILLGLVREGDFISHDDDFDAAFLVEANTPTEAAAEFFRVFNYLKDQGLQVSFGAHIGNFHLKLPELPVIDIFMMYYREQTRELCGFNIVSECGRDAILPLQNASLIGQEVLVPNHPEALLEATYGPSWKIPDPYFQWQPSPRLKKLNSAYQVASKAIEAGEPPPLFSDDKVAA